MHSSYIEAFGLTFRTQVRCGEARPGSDTAPASADCAPIDVVVGETPSTLGADAVSGHKFEALPGRLLLHTHTIADYLVEGGERITVSPKPDAEPTSICNLLYGWATGGLLIQRGTLALHASAVETPGGAVLFCGPSGVGKSTLVSLLMARGLRLLDDNIAALDIGDHGINVQPGLGSIRLTDDTLALSGRSTADLARLSVLKPKYIVPLDEHEFCPSPTPLSRIFILHRAEKPARRTLQAAEKMNQLQRQTFVGRFAPGLGALETLFGHWIRVGNEVPMALLAVPMDRSPQTWADQLIDEL